MVKLLACGARWPGFNSRPRHLNFHRLVISCFQVAIWLKYRWSDVNPQHNQPTNRKNTNLVEGVECLLPVNFRQIPYSACREVKLSPLIRGHDGHLCFPIGPKYILSKLLPINLLPITRAPRGTDRSPEYNEHFCYKLDSRVKNLTTEWNEKQQHFITHASRSLLWIQFVAVAFRSEEEVFEEGDPPWPILPRPGSAPGQTWQKHLYACAGPWALNPYQVS